LIEKALGSTARELLDRACGRPSQAIEARIEKTELKEMSDDELLAIIHGERAAARSRRVPMRNPQRLQDIRDDLARVTGGRFARACAVLCHRLPQWYSKAPLTKSKIMEITRHKDTSVLINNYIRPVALFEDHAAQGLL
jgi:hypothetical protein